MFSTSELTNIFNSFNDKKVLIIGDIMLDNYMFGKVHRFSPEAPVPIVNLEKQTNLLGGASNVALNIKALGAQPILCSVVGEDEYGKILLQLLKEQDISIDGIEFSNERKTTIKSRVFGNTTQLIRIDEEDTFPLSNNEEVRFIKKIENIFKHKNIDIILFQDYDKGSITPNIIDFVSQQAKAKNIPITVDPKKRNFLHYKNVTLFKPNLKELSEGIGASIIPTEEISLIQAIEQLNKLINPEIVMLTLSEHGIAIYNNNSIQKFPAFLRNISDVSGAGDTVISVATLCLILGIELEKIAQLSNLAGGLVCEQVGVVPIDKEILQKEAFRFLLSH